MPPGKVFADLRKLALRLHKLHAETLLISSSGVRLPASTRVISIPSSIPEIYTPIPYIVPGQLFAASLAEVKGLDPDKPRSLQIVTRTV
jgi:glucosamine--fructose-6-phosphate aminotransferase (isomerizing)